MKLLIPFSLALKFLANRCGRRVPLDRIEGEGRDLIGLDGSVNHSFSKIDFICLKILTLNLFKGNSPFISPILLKQFHVAILCEEVFSNRFTDISIL